LLARILWPDAEVDAEERLRKVIRKRTSEIFQDWEFVTRLWRQLELSKFLEITMRQTARTSTAHKSPARPRRRNNIPLTFGQSIPTTQAPNSPSHRRRSLLAATQRETGAYDSGEKAVPAQRRKKGPWCLATKPPSRTGSYWPKAPVCQSAEIGYCRSGSPGKFP